MRAKEKRRSENENNGKTSVRYCKSEHPLKNGKLLAREQANGTMCTECEVSQFILDKISNNHN